VLAASLALLAGSSTVIGLGASPAGGTAPQARANTDATIMAAFGERVQAYADLHRKVESSLPPLPDEATPAAIDTHQRAFAARIAKTRAGARPGDVFSPDMQRVVRRLLARLFRDPQARRELRASIMDDNPKGMKLAVNGRYPDAVPLSTMPPDVLKQLPVLPEELEYRFVGETLILLDPDAHIVVDYVAQALPR
jgi:hypothetical protein